MTGAGAVLALAASAVVALQLVFVVFVLLRPRVRQASSMAWILVIVALPVIGMALYLAVGEVRPGSKRKRRHRVIHRRISAALARAWGNAPSPPLAEGTPRAVARLARLVSYTEPRAGNRLRLLARTRDFADALADDIASARLHVHMVFYIYLDDEVGRRIGRALMECAGRGVECRLLADNVGSAAFLKSDLCKEMRRAGVEVVSALPTRINQIASIRFDMRNHRKIVVVDGRIGYTGSHNVASAAFHPKPRFAPWIDATLRIDGPAVRDLQALFVEDWYLDAGENLDPLITIDPERHADGTAIQVVGSGVNSRNQALVRVIQSAIHTARRELVLTTPYFVPDEGTVAALTTAALRGVATIIVVPSRNDSLLVGLASRSYYQGLLDAGAEVHEFQRGLLHAKTMTVDRGFAMVSTANMDRRSFDINFEVTTLVYDSGFASRLRSLQDRYLDDCRPVDATAWTRRRWPRRLAENAGGLLGPLL